MGLAESLNSFFPVRCQLSGAFLGARWELLLQELKCIELCACFKNCS